MWCSRYIYLFELFYLAPQWIYYSGTWYRSVPSGSDRILIGTTWNPVGTTWNQLESGRNHLEPTGSDRYLRGTVKYCHLTRYWSFRWNILLFRIFSTTYSSSPSTSSGGGGGFRQSGRRERETTSRH